MFTLYKVEVVHIKYKILVIDDEDSILDMLRLNLELEKYQVYTANSSLSAMEKLSYNPDLILLDINMPKVSGIELCIKIRDYVPCPIIFLTARAGEQDKINGFKVGGDDYITKPFSIDELLIRIKAHLRREERTITRKKKRFTEDLVIDYESRQLFIKNQAVMLSKKEFDIIYFLSMNAGIVFDKERLYEKIWGYDSDGDSNVIKEHIRKIRKKISEYTDVEYLVTVRGVGYKWEN